MPANIALIAGAKNTAEGKKFIAYTLSKDGQELLLKPEISRLPVLPYKNLSNVPEGYPDPGEIAKRSKVQFDVDLSQSRYYIVQSLFDQTITFRHADLQAGHQGDSRCRGQTRSQHRREGTPASE